MVEVDAALVYSKGKVGDRYKPSVVTVGIPDRNVKIPNKDPDSKSLTGTDEYPSLRSYKRSKGGMSISVAARYMDASAVAAMTGIRNGDHRRLVGIDNLRTGGVRS